MFINRPDSKNDDFVLIERFRSRDDQDALGELFSRYSALVYGVCLKYLKDRDDAKDAVMQIFEKLGPGLKKHPIDHFRAWLYATSRNHCLMRLRAAKGIFVREIDESLMENELILHQEDVNQKEEDLTKLEKCIQALKDEQKLCVELFYLKELCYNHIVEKTGIELKGVKSHIQNGKRNLKLCMERIA